MRGLFQSKKFYIILLILVIFLFTNKIEKFTITRPSKCFSCEKDIIRREGILNIWKALPTKCFDCENHAVRDKVNPYNTGPNKCFDCECSYFKNKGIQDTN